MLFEGKCIEFAAAHCVPSVSWDEPQLPHRSHMYHTLQFFFQTWTIAAASCLCYGAVQRRYHQQWKQQTWLILNSGNTFIFCLTSGLGHICIEEMSATKIWHITDSFGSVRGPANCLNRWWQRPIWIWTLIIGIYCNLHGIRVSYFEHACPGYQPGRGPALAWACPTCWAVTVCGEWVFIGGAFKQSNPIHRPSSVRPWRVCPGRTSNALSRRASLCP